MKVTCLLLAVFLFLFFAFSGVAYAQGDLVDLTLPGLKVSVDGKDPHSLSLALQIVLLLTVLSLAPAILIMLTSFTRIVVVFSILRQALGTPQMPPNQLLVGLALFLTLFIMAPVWRDINGDALQPYMRGNIGVEEAYSRALTPLRDFMFKQTRERDLALFMRVSRQPRPKTYKNVPTRVLIPAFILSELKTAFEIGFLIYIPFLLIDMIVSSILLSMGMLMLPPVMVSLPFKLMLFVLVDGWYLIVGSLVQSFRV